MRDPLVELDVTGKHLGEDGFHEVADALTRSLEHQGETGRVVQLEELCLKANELKTTCLPALARIIRLSAHELRDLDLSDNAFTITTTHEADAWETFLTSFAQCCVLRRIDLSGNPLGPKAFEILARVYSREPTIELALHGNAEDTLHGHTTNRRGTAGEIESLDQQTRNLSLVSASNIYSDDDDNNNNNNDNEGLGSVDKKTVRPGAEHGWSTLLLLSAARLTVAATRPKIFRARSKADYMSQSSQ